MTVSRRLAGSGHACGTNQRRVQERRFRALNPGVAAHATRVGLTQDIAKLTVPVGTKNKAYAYDDDGSLTLYVGHTSPGADRESNWLAAPDTTFSLYRRAYGGKPGIADGIWVPPAADQTGSRHTPPTRCAQPVPVAQSSIRDPQRAMVNGRSASRPRRSSLTNACGVRNATAVDYHRKQSLHDGRRQDRHGPRPPRHPDHRAPLATTPHQIRQQRPPPRTHQDPLTSGMS